MLDDQNRVIYANFASEGFFQSSSASLRGGKVEKLMPFGSPAIDMLERVRTRMAAIREYNIDLSSPRTGKNAVVDIFATPLNETKGNVVMILQKRAMADKIDRQLTHRSAARTVTGLAAMLAHEIKNPLSGISGAAQLLEQSVNNEDRTLTRLIREETDRIVKLVDRMEVFSDESLPARDPVNIHSVLEHVKTLALSGFGRGVKFVENYDPSLPAVFANRDQLVQVFINLIKNSCEAMEQVEEPCITMSTAYRSGINIIRPGSSKKISLPLEFSIADNGNGISDGIISNVFDPFITTKSNGTGLGLALVSKIISNHGGVIEINSTPSGTNVRILMPAWDGPEKKTGEGCIKCQLKKNQLGSHKFWLPMMTKVSVPFLAAH